MKEKEDTKNRRLFDVTIPIAMAEIKQELKDFKSEMYGKLDNGISGSLEKIKDKVMGLQCNVHIEKFSGVEDKLKGMDKKVNGLYWAFVIVIIGGIILSLWMRNGIRQKVSMAIGQEGYRMSQMIYRDLHKGEL